VHHDESDDAVGHTVVVNDEGQFSVWPTELEVPAGWRPGGHAGDRQTCLAHIGREWQDMRPLSLRNRRTSTVSQDEKQWRCVQDVIRDHARARPNVCAVQRTDHGLTYRALDAQSSSIAGRLVNWGVGPEVLVGICGRRSPELVTGLLGVLKAGGGYVYIDATQPAARIRHVIADARLRLVLSTDDVSEGAWLEGTRHLRIRSLSEAEGAMSYNVGCDVAPGNVATVIYTSGTSGRPKGVAISHGAIMCRVGAQPWRPNTKPGCQRASFGLVAHVADLLVSLANGRTVVILDDAAVAHPVTFARTVVAYGITQFGMVPSQLHAILESREAVQLLSDVEHVVVSGEPLPAAVADAFHLQLPKATLTNAYGMSETSGLVASSTIIEGAPIVIGSPPPDVRVYVLGTNLRAVTSGATGELCVGGHQLASGYIGRPELTADRFVPDPFGPPGSRMLRTGDLGREVAPNVFAVSGRLDDEVQVRGHRVDIAEVECVLNGAPGVSQAAVVYDQGHETYGRLRALVVPKPSGFTASAARGHMLSRLPEYMIPVSIATIEAIPLLPSGKIDRQRVLSLATRETDAVVVQAIGRDHDALVMEALWVAVLDKQVTPANATFFDLGGESLAAMRLLARITEQWGLELTFSELFDHPTVEALNRLVQGRLAEAS
jgi:amino acid adenylation domain-containing protein